MTSPRPGGAHRARARATTAPAWLRLAILLAVVAGIGGLVGVALRSRPPLEAPAARPTEAISAPTTAPAGAPTSAPSASSAPSRSAPPQASPTGGPVTSPSASSASSAPEAARLPLLVLNNSRVDRLAARAAADFRRGGWPVRGTGNFRGRIEATTVYYEPGQLASAQRLAREFPKVRRVLPRFAGLPGSGLTVVVTRDYAG